MLQCSGPRGEWGLSPIVPGLQKSLSHGCLGVFQPPSQQVRLCLFPTPWASRRARWLTPRPPRLHPLPRDVFSSRPQANSLLLGIMASQTCVLATPGEPLAHAPREGEDRCVPGRTGVGGL